MYEVKTEVCEHNLLSGLHTTLSTDPDTTMQGCGTHFMLGSASKSCMVLVSVGRGEGSAWGVLHRATLPEGVPAASVAVAAE